MKRILGFIALLIAVMACEAKEVVKIGAILPLSGNQAPFGESIRKAVQMHIEELNTSGANRFSYQVVFEDDQAQGRLSAQAFQKLKSLDKINAVLTFSAQGTAIAPLAQQSKIIHFGLGSAPALSEGKYNFVHWATIPPPVKMMAETLQTLGYKRVAILSQKHSSINAQTAEFVKTAPAYGLTILCDEKLNPDEKDARTTILRIKELKPDIVLLNCLNPVGEIVLRQMNELNYTPSISAITCLYALKRDVLKDIWWVDPSIARPEFYAKYEAKFKAPLEVGASNHYDSVGLLAYAYEQWEGQGLPDADFVAEKLMAVRDYVGAMGPANPTPEGIFDLPPKLVTVKDDFSGYKVLSLEEVKTIEAAKRKH